jgi:hypothetical protein
MRCSLRHRLIALALAAGALLPRAVQAVEETELKAAIVFNILLFVDWPASALPVPSSPLVLCVPAGSALHAPLKAMVGRDVRGHRLELRDLVAPDAARPCHAVFVDAADRRPAALLKAHSAGGALVISDDADASKEATAILLHRVDRKIAFDVNLQPTRQSGLQLSSKLLRLARAVKE